MNRLIVLGVLILVSSCVCADGDIGADYYRSTILSKDSGVYEHDGVLYVHSTASIESLKPTAKKRAQLEAMLGLDSMLKAWAVSNTAPLRVLARPRPEGIAYAERILDSWNPDWRFASWKLQSVPARKIPNVPERGRYVCALEIKRNELLAKLPEIFLRPCGESEVMDEVRKVVGTRLNGPKPAKTLVRCGVCDLVGTEGIEESVVEEFRRVNEQITKYFIESEFGRKTREEERELSIPLCTTNRIVRMNASGTVCVETNEIVTVTRIPRFHRLLLNPQAETNAALERMESGTKALAAAFDKTRAVEEQALLLKSALEENPGDKELWNLYGSTMKKKGEPMVSISCFRNALKLDGKYVAAQINLATVYKELGYSKLAFGLALAARSVATDDWSIEKSELILTGGRRLERSPAKTIPAPTSKPVVQQQKVASPEPIPESVPVSPKLPEVEGKSSAPEVTPVASNVLPVTDQPVRNLPKPTKPSAGSGILANEVIELDY